MQVVLPHASHDRLNVLIVDDDEGDRKQLRRALKSSGLACDSVETASVEEALEACGRVAFDCAIVDYRMPGADGLQGVAALHERLPYMAIIMATGQGNESVATEAMKCGATDYIGKSEITAESIRHRIESTVERADLRRQVAGQQEELEIFASVLVHDLNAPIASMQMFAGAIADDLGARADEESDTAENCVQLIDAGRRAGALIDALYQYTRADRHVAFERVDMRQAMENTLINLKHAIQNRDARVTYGALPVVIGNAPQLAQLLQNLIGNSIKFCEAATPTVHVTASQNPENVWQIAVKDNGIGIPEKNYREIFEPFKRLHGVATYEGSGLGLATCKKIVERHGGAIRCESGNEGSSFFFALQGADG
jgi:signal transduction histidine kinase